MEYKEPNKGSLDGVTRRFELECCTFVRRQGKYSARIWAWVFTVCPKIIGNEL